MKKLPILTVIILSLLYSCYNNPNIKYSAVFEKTFSSEEKDALYELIYFVDDYVLDYSNETNIENAYHSYFNDINKIEILKREPLIPDTIKYKFLGQPKRNVLEMIIQIDSVAQSIRYKDSLYTNVENIISFSLYPKGNFYNYLYKIGKTDEKYADLANKLSAMGGMPPGPAIWFPQNHRQFNFNIMKDRLWAAIFIMNMQENLIHQMDRKIKAHSN